MVLLRPARIKAMAESGLAHHLNLVPQIDEISVSFWPRWRIDGRGLSLRVPDRPDLPPFISIETFSMNVGLLSMIRRHVKTVHATGLKIAVPPGEVRASLSGSDRTRARPDVIIDHFVTHEAELAFVPRKPDGRPLTFQIHDLTVDAVGFNSQMPFDAVLTNPVPRGLVKAHGLVGPWLATDGPETPLSGEYTFSDADLSTINGIGGVLQSAGRFTGDLQAIAVVGQATIPDFSLDLGGKPAPLACEYEAVVDGTDGTTVLNRVDAILLGTHMAVTGAIRNLAGPGNHQIDLIVRIAGGNLEDLLALALDTPRPVMIGDISLQAALSLPPGPGRVRDRLKVDGVFGLTRTRFTDGDVTRKLHELSRRGQGKAQDDPMERVLTDLGGRFRLDASVMGLRELRFRVPGAEVALDGTYSLATQEMDLRGTLRLQATVSQAVGGFKSIFIRPFDGLFRKDGAGTVLPIKITGSRSAPKFGVEAGRIFKKQ